MPLRHAFTQWRHAIRHHARLWRQRLPSQCLLCQRWPAQALCESCWQTHAPNVPRCLGCGLRQVPLSQGHPPPVHCGQCLTQPPLWQHAHAAVSYEHRWRELIAQFKFQADLGLAVPLAQRMAQVTSLRPMWMAFDGLVPIPMGRRALAARGFNPAERLAWQLCPQRMRMHLQRVHESPAQHRLNRAQRLHNMARAFQVRPGAVLQGQRLLLVDDVMTTGATLHAATQALLNAGAAHVDVLVFARTERV